MTFGKWRVKESESLDVVTVVDPNKEYRIRYLTELVVDYKKHLDKLPPDEREVMENFLIFFANEFSKKVNNNYGYKISALLTKRLLDGEIDGILYPSVQTEGNGLCIAIHPRAMYKLELIEVLQCNVTKKGSKVNISENLQFCEVIPPSHNFQLKPIEAFLKTILLSPQVL